MSGAESRKQHVPKGQKLLFDGMGRRLTWQVKGLAEVWDFLGLGEAPVPAEPPAYVSRSSLGGDAIEAMTASQCTQ